MDLEAAWCTGLAFNVHILYSKRVRFEYFVPPFRISLRYVSALLSALQLTRVQRTEYQNQELHSPQFAGLDFGEGNVLSHESAS